MKEKLLVIVAFLAAVTANVYSQSGGLELPSKLLSSQKHSLTISNLFYETSKGRMLLPQDIVTKAKTNGALNAAAKMPDGRTITVSIAPNGKTFDLSLTAVPSEGIIKWGLSIDSESSEYYTGLM